MADERSLGEAPSHEPVLFHEVLSWLEPRDGALFIDATVGLGGHAHGLLAGLGPSGRLLGLDADPQALELASERLAEFGQRAVLTCGRHRDLEVLARQQGFEQVDGVLLDLGASSLQFDQAERGFSFRNDGPLDMRMGPDVPQSAAEIVNGMAEEELARVIWLYGEERHSRRIAAAICRARPLTRTTELAQLVARVVPGKSRIHPATRTFQALRIAVNDELESLQAVLPQAVALLKPGGRLAVIAFHSLEDRIVKQFMVRESTDCLCPPRLPACVCGHRASVQRLTKKPVRPSQEELAANPRSRSSRLRVVAKLAPATPDDQGGGNG